jgi:hypothetical protein
VANRTVSHESMVKYLRWLGKDIVEIIFSEIISGPVLIKSGPVLIKAGPVLIKSGPVLIKYGPVLIKYGPVLKSGRVSTLHFT